MNVHSAASNNFERGFENLPHCTAIHAHRLHSRGDSTLQYTHTACTVEVTARTHSTAGNTNVINIYVKTKVKVTLEQATKAHRGTRVIALLFL